MLGTGYGVQLLSVLLNKECIIPKKQIPMAFFFVFFVGVCLLIPARFVG